jgi:outer membrane protein OmpA-like peptidoglycan-associated protein/curli biogenesis system outer membrane secretion channel CsgG
MNTRKCVFILLTLAAFAAGSVERQAIGQTAPQHKPRVAILDFDYATVQSSSAAIFGNDIDIGKGISDLLVTDLVRSGSYSVIERSAIDKVLAEQNFSNSNRADPGSAARIGKILGADYIIVGSITEFGNETTKQNVGGVGGGFHGFGIGGIGHSNSKANVAIDARVINIDTAEILAVAEGKGQSSRSGVSLLGGGGNWSGFGGGNVDFGSSNFQNTIIGEATKKAVDQLTTDLIASAATLPVHTVNVDALVASVDGGQIVLNAGAKAGIKVGDQLSVVRVGREIKDPATGQVIRRLTSNVGTIRATDVDDVSAVCNVVSGSGFQIGDHAVTPGSSPGAGSSAAPVAAPAMAPMPSPQPAASVSSPPLPASSNLSASNQGAPSPPASSQPDLTAVKADFIPGDKVIFADDFSDMAGDEPPPHWKVRGGTAELRVGGGIRQLTLHGDDVYLTPNLTGGPPNFTLEADILYSEHWEYVNWEFKDSKGDAALIIKTRRNYTNLMVDIQARGDSGMETLYDQQFETVFDKPVKEQIWCQDGRFRMYVNGNRVVDVNQIKLPQMNAPMIDVGNANGEAYVGFRNVRMAESTPDFGQVIASTGHFVTHGILFDTDSDRIKPESAAVIQEIARGLSQSSDLNVEIDGHTDSTGAAPHNMELSKRRAEAVKNILVAQFSIDGGRLTTAGFGSSKPIDTNNTTAGKAQNRRVEFVRK